MVAMFSLAGGAILGMLNWLFATYHPLSILYITLISVITGLLLSQRIQRFSRTDTVTWFVGAAIGSILGTGIVAEHGVSITLIPTLAIIAAELTITSMWWYRRRQRRASEVQRQPESHEGGPDEEALDIVPPPQQIEADHNYKGEDFLEKIRYIYLQSEQPVYLEGWHWSRLVPGLSLAMTVCFVSVWGVTGFSGYQTVLDSMTTSLVPFGLIMALIGFLMLMKRLAGRLITWDRRKIVAGSLIAIGLWITLRLPGLEAFFETASAALQSCGQYRLSLLLYGAGTWCRSTVTAMSP